MSMSTPINNEKLKETVEKIKNSKTLTRGSCELEEILYKNSETEIAKLERYKQDTRLKSMLANFVRNFTIGWSIGILVLVYLVSYSNNNFNQLSDAVLITLISETLCLVLGLPLIVITHFFPKKSNSNKKED